MQALPKRLKDIENKLYTENEYGVVYQDTSTKLSDKDIRWLKESYGINTNWHPMCVNCQARQLIKYYGEKNQDGEVNKFSVKCNGVVRDFSITRSQLDSIVQTTSMDEDAAIRYLKALNDPVAWASLMFGFSDDNENFRLRPYQKEQLRCSSLRLVIREGRRAGKALPLNTRVPTPSGWSTMGELRVGDQVFGPDGIPTNVTFITDTMYHHDIYKITFDDGSTMQADAEHQWTVSSRSSRSRVKQGTLESEQYTCTTQDLVDGNIIIGQEFNYRIKLTEPVQYSHKELPVDPYRLGCWLGDEESNLNINNVKRIPQEYLYGSVKQRWELLRGLMDSHGSVDEAGYCEYTTINPELAESFYELACSLGLKVNQTNPSLDDVRYKFYINTNAQMFNLSWKQIRIDSTASKRQVQDYRAITKIELVTSVPVRCITVDNDEHLYLVGKQFLPTHNTFAMALKLLYLAFTQEYNKGVDAQGNEVIEGPEIMVVTPYQSQISNIFGEMQKLLKRNEALQRHVTTSSGGTLFVKTPFHRLELDNGAKISGFVSGVGTKIDGSGGGTMRGRNANIIYLDEMDMIPNKIIEEVVMPILLTSAGVMLIATSTPIGKRDKFFNWCMNRPDFKEDYFPSTVLPNWNDIKHEILEDTNEDGFEAEYMAKFIDGANGVFKPSYIYAARQDYVYRDTENINWWHHFADIRETTELIKVIGIDWNKNAGTEFVVVGYHPGRNHWYVLESVNISAGRFSSAKWKEEVARLNYKWKPDYIYADEGYGHTIIEDLQLTAMEMQRKKKKDKFEAQTAKLMERLVAYNFSQKVELRSPIDGRVITKTGKEFLVENAVSVFEDNRIWFSEQDKSLLDQLLNYRVLRRSITTNKPIYGPENERIGDHRLDALMLALGGITLEYSLYSKRSRQSSEPAFLSKELLDERSKESDSPSALDALMSVSSQPDRFGQRNFQVSYEDFVRMGKSNNDRLKDKRRRTKRRKSVQRESGIMSHIEATKPIVRKADGTILQEPSKSYMIQPRRRSNRSSNLSRRR
jgi:hypothetical protein